MRVEFEKKGIMHKIPHEVKCTKYFQLSGYKENKTARFSMSKITVIYSGKNYFNYHETRPVKRVHFDVAFPFHFGRKQ